MKQLDKVFLLLTIICLTAPTVVGQGFKITSDTVKIDVRGKAVSVLKHHDKYYCQFVSKVALSRILWSYSYYILSADGSIQQKVDLPPKVYGEKNDFFVRNDSVIVKSFHYLQNCFYLDFKKLKWMPIATSEDVVYEDNDYYITHLKVGSWGNTTWFKNKKTGEEYIASCGYIVDKLDSVYYFTTHKGVFTVKDPTKLKKCPVHFAYKKVAKENSFNEEEASMRGVKTIISSLCGQRECVCWRDLSE